MPVRFLVPVVFAVGLEIMVWILRAMKKESKVASFAAGIAAVVAILMPVFSFEVAVPKIYPMNGELTSEHPTIFISKDDI